MRKLILNVAVSLDGFIEGPNGEFDWCFTDQDYGMTEFFARIDALFIGRKSYEVVQQMGEEATGSFPKMTEYIFSTTLQEVKPGAILINGDLKTEVERIKAEPGKDIWLFGGALLTHALMELGLVDELLLAVHPLILGKGKPLFSDFDGRIALKLLNTITYSSGLVSLQYQPQLP